MIARLRGEIIERGNGVVVIECAGVGYEVHVPENVLMQLAAVGDGANLHIRQVFREDGTALYGFVDPVERRLFDLLTDVKGCGPRISLALLGTLGPDSTIAAIQISDTKTLCKANGVGPRLAERITLELREKIQEVALNRKLNIATGHAVAKPLIVDDELVEALVGLGLRRLEAEVAAAEARTQSDTLEEQIRIALRVRNK